MKTSGETERTPASGNGAASLGERVRSLRLTHGGAPAGGGRRQGSPLPWALVVVLLLTTFVLGYRAYRVAPVAVAAASAPAPQHTDATTTSAPGDVAAVPVAASGDVVLQAKGYVIPAHQVQLSPKVGGMMVWLDPRFQEGAYFKEGEVLAKLETVNYQAEFDHAVAALRAAEQRRDEQTCYRKQEIEQAQRELDEARAQLVQMDLELRRNVRLTEMNSLATREYEQARYGRDAMARKVDRLRAALDMWKEGPRREKLLAAEADVAAAKADLNKAKWNLDNCDIRAPISGHVLKKNAEKGNVVNPLAFNVATSLCEMADLADLEIDLSIQERDISHVHDGQPCDVMPEAYANYDPFRKKHPQGYQAVVSRQMPTADKAKGAVPVRVKVRVPTDEVGIYLKPDMGVLVSFYKGGKETAAAK
jgi:multidrug resistance efflux pump